MATLIAVAGKVSAGIMFRNFLLATADKRRWTWIICVYLRLQFCGCKLHEQRVGDDLDEGGAVVGQRLGQGVVEVFFLRHTDAFSAA